MATVKIKDRVVGENEPTFVIAEIGINHNGSVSIAKQLIDIAVESGCQAVKFQKRTIDVVYTEEELARGRVFDASFLIHADERKAAYGYDPLPPEARARLEQNPEDTTNGDLKRILEFGEAEYRDIDEYCKKKGIMWAASPWDEQSVDFLESFDIPFYKIGSASLTDSMLLKKVAQTRKPILLSTGMSTMDQIHKAVELLEGSPLVLLHCVSTYPADYTELGLRVIQTLQKEFPAIPVGYSGHEKGIVKSICAAALGACVIERHITLDRTMPGSDQAASIEPQGLTLMMRDIRELEHALGDGVKRVLPTEFPILEKLRRVKDF